MEARTVDNQFINPWAARVRLWTGWIDKRPALLAFLISLAVIVVYHRSWEPETGDSAIWDYVAQCILRGQIPYKDVIEIKGPGSAYLSAAAMCIGKYVGIRDVISVRLMQILLLAALSA